MASLGLLQGPVCWRSIRDAKMSIVSCLLSTSWSHLYEAFYCLRMLQGSYNKFLDRLRSNSCWAPTSVCLLILFLLIPERLKGASTNTAVGAIFRGNCLACNIPLPRTSSLSDNGGSGSHCLYFITPPPWSWVNRPGGDNGPKLGQSQSFSWEFELGT